MNPVDRILQVEQECDAFRRMLEYLFQENSYLKTRLAEKTHQLTSGDSSVEKAEQLHQILIRNDELLYFLKNDINHLQKLLNNEAPALQQLSKHDLVNVQRTLRQEMNAISNNFNKIQLQINSFFDESP